MQKPIKNSQRGYSLIEIAIVLAMVGALSATAISIYGNHVVHEKTQETKEVSTNVAATVGSFRSVYGRYPCPSPIDAVAGDLDYGLENSDCKAATYGTAGSCVNGICTAQSANASSDLIVIGTLPFKSMGLRESDIYDGYGDKITYAVTAPLTAAATFNMANGGIGRRFARWCRSFQMRGTLRDEVREMVWVASVIGALSMLAVGLAVALASA